MLLTFVACSLLDRFFFSLFAIPGGATGASVMAKRFFEDRMSAGDETEISERLVIFAQLVTYGPFHGFILCEHCLPGGCVKHVNDCASCMQDFVSTGESHIGSVGSEAHGNCFSSCPGSYETQRKKKDDKSYQKDKSK